MWLETIRPELMDWHKLNKDVAVDDSNNNCAVGGLIRDSKGFIEECFSSKIGYCSPFVVEL